MWNRSTRKRSRSSGIVLRKEGSGGFQHDRRGLLCGEKQRETEGEKGKRRKLLSHHECERDTNDQVVCQVCTKLEGVQSTQSIWLFTRAKGGCLNQDTLTFTTIYFQERNIYTPKYNLTNSRAT